MTRRLIWWTLAMGLASAFPAVGQDASTAWFDLPPDQAALILFADENLGVESLSVLDAAGLEIDYMASKGDLPILRQYRLTPGFYSLHIEGLEQPLDLNLAPGEVQYLRFPLPALDGPPAVMTWPDPTRLEVEQALSELEMALGAGVAAPVEADPAGNELYFRAEPSLIRHPSPRPPKRD